MPSKDEWADDISRRVYEQMFQELMRSSRREEKIRTTADEMVAEVERYLGEHARADDEQDDAVPGTGELEGWK